MQAKLFHYTAAKHSTSPSCLSDVKDTQIDIRLKKIEEVTELTRLYRWEMLRMASAASQVKVGIKAKVELAPDDSTIKLRLTAFYTRVRGMVRRPVLDFTVDAEFEVDEFHNHFGSALANDRLIDLPPSVLTLMLSVGVGALRGMIAQRTKGTPLASTPMPLINISALVSRLIYSDNTLTHPIGTQICG